MVKLIMVKRVKYRGHITQDRIVDIAGGSGGERTRVLTSAFSTSSHEV
jgi:hypothetical protein